MFRKLFTLLFLLFSFLLKLSAWAQVGGQLLGNCMVRDGTFGSWGEVGERLSVAIDANGKLIFTSNDNKALLSFKAEQAEYYERGPYLIFHGAQLAPLFPISLLVGMTHQKTSVSFYPELKEFYIRRYIGSIAMEPTWDQDFVCGQFDGDINDTMAIFPQLKKKINQAAQPKVKEDVITLDIEGLPTTVSKSDLKQMDKNKKVHWARTCSINFRSYYNSAKNEEIPVIFEQAWTTADRKNYKLAAKDCINLRQDWEVKNQYPIPQMIDHKLDVKFGEINRFYYDHTPATQTIHFDNIENLLIVEKQNKNEGDIETWECRVQYYAQSYISKMSWAVTTEKEIATEMCQQFSTSYIQDYVEKRRDEKTHTIAIVLKQQ